MPAPTQTPWRSRSRRSSREREPVGAVVAGAAQQRAQPGAELADVEGLGEVVVGPRLEPVDAVLRDPAARRAMRTGTWLPARRRRRQSATPVHVGQARVEDDRVGPARRRAGSARAGRSRRATTSPAARRRARSAGRRGSAVVLDDEDAGGRRRGRRRASAGTRRVGDAARARWDGPGNRLGAARPRRWRCGGAVRGRRRAAAVAGPSGGGGRGPRRRRARGRRARVTTRTPAAISATRRPPPTVAQPASSSHGQRRRRR